jgi:hypothetical protein
MKPLRIIGVTAALCGVLIIFAFLITDSRRQEHEAKHRHYHIRYGVPQECYASPCYSQSPLELPPLHTPVYSAASASEAHREQPSCECRSCKARRPTELNVAMELAVESK